MAALDDAIRETVRNIWSVILNLELSEGQPTADILEKVRTEPTLTGCVQLTGAWEGSVLVYTTAELARRAASAMFGTEAEQLAAEDVEDALAELTNMTAGNIKTLLPRPSELSLPAVVKGIDYRLVVPGSKLTSKVVFSSLGEPYLVTLLEKTEGAEITG
jgi:chemotaxis protein CheX